MDVLRGDYMIRIRVIARGAIINPNTKKKYTDAELRCINLYFEDIKEVEENYDKFSIIKYYEQKFHETRGWTFQINKL